MRSSIPIEPGARLRRIAAQRAEHPPAPGVSAADRVLSEQALRLHALAVAASGRTASKGFISRSVVTSLAEECGALPDELVQAGFWVENDLNYVIKARWIVPSALRPETGALRRERSDDRSPSP